MAGYARRPLAAKLGIREGTRIHVVDSPGSYSALLGTLPRGARQVARLSATTDLIHLFCTRRAELERRLGAWRRRLRPDAAIWVSWPKKSSRAPTDITEDTIRSVALPMGFVDVKVCAVTETWSGLKLVLRKELRRPER